MDLRVIDVRTGRIGAATSAHGEATPVAAGVSGPMGAGLGGFAKTPMETAVREMIKKAVDFVVGKTPGVYYRHSTTSGAAPAAPKAVAPIRTDRDPNEVARLTHATVRCAGLTAAVSLTPEGTQQP